MNHLMIDIETLGTTPGSIILSIGALRFDPVTGATGEDFYRQINPSLSEIYGFTASVDTMLWWMDQAPSAQAEAFGGQVDDPKHNPLIALRDFRDFVLCGLSASVWSHGCMDIVLIEAACRKHHGVDIPWGFRQVRDTRTVYDLADIDMRSFALPTDLHHHPVSDCRVQVRALHAAYKKLGLAA